MIKTKIFFVFLAFLVSTTSYSQNTAEVYGYVRDEQRNPVEVVNIAVFDEPYGTSTEFDGFYKLKVPAGKKIRIVVSHLGYEAESREVELNVGESREVNFILKLIPSDLPALEVKEKRIRQSNYIRINPAESRTMPTIKGGVEDLIKTQMGVTSRNELSSQYSVRGGNFDENLVYVNGIEIYRPFLIRAGQQEGLSFINSDLVSSVVFSAGGFDAKYGDKMSSVLDIQYKKPNQFKASASFSLLGSQAHAEGISKNRKFSYLTGFRYQSNQYILKGLQTRGEYKPSFTDAQALLTYELSDNWELSFLGNYARNFYKLIPENRETKFGTISEAYQLRIYFDGQEIDNFETMLGAISASYQPNNDLKLRFISSAFQTIESETYDIQGQYWIGRLETTFGEDQFGDAIDSRGVGTYLDHARNYLQATVLNIQHKGTYSFLNKNLQWGIRLQHEIIDDNMNEWEMIDSAGFSIPRPKDSIGSPQPPRPALFLNNVVKNDVNISTNRLTSFVQNTWEYAGLNYDLAITGGFRINFWDFNNQFLFSPRGTIAYSPGWNREVIFRFSTGYYYQPPFYKELRDRQGNINTDIKAQKSIHFVGGTDINFKAWSRPFKLTTEVYYKILDDLIPYEVDNVRIRYYAENIAKGYAAGIDFKVNGEFVKGVESWASLSILTTQEDIENDFYYEYFNQDGDPVSGGSPDISDSLKIEPGYLRRPTDQRVSFSLFFQDYIPGNPTYKMHLRLIFGSRLPFGPPNTEKYQHTLLIPPYRRVDIGFSKQIIGANAKRPSKGFFSHFESLWISAEVFNLLQISNTISYLWVKDVTNRQYAVPNYLTPRQLNIKLVASF